MQPDSQSPSVRHLPLVKEDDSMAEKKMLSDQELVGTLYNAGFRGERLETAFAVAKAESNARPKAYNPPTNNTGDNSYGIFQINMIGDLGPDRRERYSLKRNEDLFDPDRNARIAFEMSNNGKDWGKWTTFTGGKYKEFLNDAKKALEQFKNVNINVESLKNIEGLQSDVKVFESIGNVFRLPYQKAFASAKEVASLFVLPGMNK